MANIKNSGEVIRLSEDEIALITKSYSDPLHFINTYCLGPDLSGEGSRRVSVIDLLHADGHAMAIGNPTDNHTVAAYLLWKSLFRSDQTILIVAETSKAARNILALIKFFFERLPNFLQTGVVVYNKDHVSWDNGTLITARAMSSYAGKGMSLSIVWCANFSEAPTSKARDFWTAVLPTLTCGGRSIVTGTCDPFSSWGGDFRHQIAMPEY